MRQCPSCGLVGRPGARFCDGCGTPLAVARPPGVERRKIATLLFCDVVGSTSLGERVDPEAVHDIMFQYFTEMRSAIERHGGTVEKFIGDAVVAAFGVPTAHEDDALRAVRAAGEMLERLDVLNERLDRRYDTRIGLRIGVNSGEVVTGDPTQAAALVTGEAVNLAARLEQAAGVGEVLLGQSTYDLVREAVWAEPCEPMTVKGKAKPVAAYRLKRIDGAGVGRRSAARPLVGRRHELDALDESLREAVAARRAVAALVVGEPGIGKSALAQGFLRERAAGARAVATRCLRYGEGASWPIAQLIREVARITEGMDRAAARGRLEDVLRPADDRDALMRPLEHVLGITNDLASPDEIAWAVRRLLETVASERPVVVVVDDLQWAEAPVVDLLRALHERASCPLLLLLLARPELGVRLEPARELRLGPLPQDEAREIVDTLVGSRDLDDGARARILAAADGNPLFLGELVSFLGHGDALSSEVPLRLELLISARLDALAPEDRATLERGSIEGEVFHRGALIALADGEESAAVAESLRRLEDAGFIRPTSATIAGELGFRFHHLMVRDVAYRSAPKRRRAVLHVRFADWLMLALGDTAGEFPELVGFHLEQAWKLRAELGNLDDDAIAAGAHASHLLGSAARRSLARGDAITAAALVARAVPMAVLPRARVELVLLSGIAAREVGAFARAEDVLESVLADARASGWRDLEAHARLELALLRLSTPPFLSGEQLRAEGDAARATFEDLGDRRGLALSYLLLAEERWNALRCAEMEELLEQALVHGEHAGDDRLVALAVVMLSRAVLFGPRPAAEAAERCDALLARAGALGPTVEATITVMLSALAAAIGDAERSEALARAGTSVFAELSSGTALGRAHMYGGFAGLVGCDWERAERELRQAYALLDDIGERGVASSVVALLARALLELDQADEAESFARLALEWAAEDDVASLAYAAASIARARAERGDAPGARRHAADALAISASSDFLIQRGDVCLDVALALAACGDSAQALEAAGEAASAYRAKGSTVALARAVALLGAIDAASETEDDPQAVDRQRRDDQR